MMCAPRSTDLPFTTTGVGQGNSARGPRSLSKPPPNYTISGDIKIARWGTRIDRGGTDAMGCGRDAPERRGAGRTVAEANWLRAFSGPVQQAHQGPPLP